MNFLQALLLLGCIQCGLCQQTPAAQFMAQVNEFCSTHCQSCGGIAAPPRVDQPDPGNVDYGAINRNLTNMFTVLEESPRLENAIVEQSVRDQDIRQLQAVMGTLRRLVGLFLGQAGFKNTSNGYSYEVIYSITTWQEAAEDCRSRGEILISTALRDPTARAEILDFMANSPFWIGASDIAQEGRWVWEDGVQSDGNDVGWHPGEPNDAGSAEDCAISHKNSEGASFAYDHPCQTEYDHIQHYLCEPAP